MNDKEWREEAENNASRIGREIENLQELQHNYHEFWDFNKQVIEMFKTLKPLSRVDRERLWSNYSEICENVKKEMTSKREEAIANASRIEQEIGNLRLSTDRGWREVRYYYRDFWAQAKEISNLFKSLKLLKEDRERLWSRFSSICDEVKSRQEEERQDSSKTRKTIEFFITEAYLQADNLSNKEKLDETRANQTEALRMMKENKLVKEDREALWKYWKEANERISWGRNRLQEFNFIEAKEEAGKCLNTAHYGDPYEALEEIKEVQRSLRGVYMDKDRRHELYDTLSMAWDKAISRIAEIKEEKKRKHEDWSQRQEEKKQRHEDWRERTESNIERWENNIEKAEDYISSLEEQIDRLEGEEANARTDEYAERVREWIEQKQEKISEVRENIQKLEEKIYDAKSKL